MSATGEPAAQPRAAFYQSVLTAHPSTTCDAVRSIAVRLARPSPQTLVFSYAVSGDLERIRWPRPKACRRADGLWRHTCLEAFVAVDPHGGYLELNFSPSGDWACYAFTRYREGMTVVDGMTTPTLTMTRGQPLERASGRSSTPGKPSVWELAAEVRISDLSESAPVNVGLAAVIENKGGSLSYWSLRHPSGKPDFHHPDAFALRI